MATIIENAQSVLQDHLEPGEVVIAATKAQLDGGTMRIAKLTGALSAGGVVAVAAAVHHGDGGVDLQAQLHNGVVIAATDRRVVLCDVSAMTAKPKSPVLMIDRSSVAAVTAGEKRVMLVKMTTISLTLRGEEPNELRFEIPKTSRADGAAVVAALQT